MIQAVEIGMGASPKICKKTGASLFPPFFLRPGWRGFQNIWRPLSFLAGLVRSGVVSDESADQTPWYGNREPKCLLNENYLALRFMQGGFAPTENLAQNCFLRVYFYGRRSTGLRFRAII